MILVHDGIVRNFSKDGRPVKSIEVSVDWKRLSQILTDARGLPGIKGVEAEMYEGRLCVGEDIMFLGVAGDTREHVIQALASTLDRIKLEASSTEEFNS
ncbi:MAG: molybdenum cofactor biosynthesis protein MoaE [Nitrospiraceae bacterium]|nr:molybdenum cofactor biosynthesis protein MoaE [Nitrospiraceae bacterium]